MNEKRGQVTVFVALGVILTAALVLAIAFRGDIARIVTEQATEGKTGFAAQVDEVKRHVDSCLSQSLKKGIFMLSGEKVKDYDKRLADEITISIGLCLKLETFTELSAKRLGEPKTEVQRNQDNTVITATFSMPVRLEKGENVEQIDEFVARENMQKKMCILEEMLDSDCRAKQDLKAGIFVFEKGQEAKIGGECLAC